MGMGSVGGLCEQTNLRPSSTIYGFFGCRPDSPDQAFLQLRCLASQRQQVQVFCIAHDVLVGFVRC